MEDINDPVRFDILHMIIDQEYNNYFPYDESHTSITDIVYRHAYLSKYSVI